MLFKKFITVCNAYKQLPLQLLVEYKKTSNVPLYKDDSTTMQGAFYLQKSGAYIRFGNSEQIITDSFALMVMEINKQMVLTQYKIDIAAQINTMINMPVKDSSVKTLSEKYTIQQKLPDNKTAVLQITNKQNIYSTSLPVETNTLIYNTSNNYPVKVETLRRTLIKKTATSKSEPGITVITIPNQGDYLLKEDLSTFTFNNIDHDGTQKLPVLISNRIEKDAAGNYTPVKAYKSYMLIVH